MPWLALLALESYQHLWVSYSPYCASHAMADASNKGNDGDDKNTNTTSLTQSIAGGIFAIGVILFIVCEILSAASKNSGCYDFSLNTDGRSHGLYIFLLCNLLIFRFARRHVQPILPPFFTSKNRHIRIWHIRMYYIQIETLFRYHCLACCTFEDWILDLFLEIISHTSRSHKRDAAADTENKK